MKKTAHITDSIMLYDCARASFFHEMRLAEKEKRRKRIASKIRSQTKYLSDCCGENITEFFKFIEANHADGTPDSVHDYWCCDKCHEPCRPTAGKE